MARFDYSVLTEYPTINIDAPGVFRPTGTTYVLMSEASQVVKQGDRVLDLGCGSGIVGLELLNRFHNLGGIEMFMSDIAQSAVDLTSKNLAETNFSAEIRQGPLLDPWLMDKFDVLVSDVSAVVPEVGLKFGWFSEAPNESGSLGVDLALEVILKASGHFRSPTSTLLMPLISLSDVDTQIQELKQNFRSVTITEKQKWPMGVLDDETESLLNSYPFIGFERIGKIGVFWTQVAVAKNPRN
jgi:SAM-dependent methyltransferase